jgi:2',3'-cyclic-nucleotide 2'-phosphodiesterase (5'-nucleotidase family)
LLLVVSGDTNGWIVPCGCASNQSGGLLRRGSYVRRLREKYDVVLADAGGAPSGTQRYDRERFEAILQGETEMGVVAHNIGAGEARLGAEYLRDVAGRLKAPLVSANVRDAEGKEIAPAVRVVEAGGKRIAVIGVVSEKFAAEGLNILPPQRAVLDAMAQQGAGCKAVVVLAYAPESELAELARSLPEVDMIVGGPTGQAVLPQRMGRVLLASATNKGKFMAQLPLPSPGEQTAGNGEIVELNERFEDDPQQRANLSRFYQRLAELDLPPRDTSFVSHQPASFPAGYRIAGDGACRQCHRVDAEHWEKTGHSHAWKTLADRGRRWMVTASNATPTALGSPAALSP